LNFSIYQSFALLIYFAPDRSGKLRDMGIYFFLDVAERPKEAPAGSFEKKITYRELATNSWNRHIILFIIAKKP